MVDKEMLLKLDHRKQVMFAVFCARQIVDLVHAKHKEVCLKAIEAAEGFLEGKVSKEECKAYADAAAGTGAYAAGAAAAYGAAYAAYAAAYAADAVYATYAAYAANAVLDRESVISEQTRYYDELLNFDKIVEDLLGV